MDEIRENNELQTKIMWGLVGLYIALVLVVIIVSIYAFFRFRELKRQTNKFRETGNQLSKWAKKVADSEYTKRILGAAAKAGEKAFKSLQPKAEK